MKSSHRLLLCVGFALPILFFAVAQDFPNAQTWEELKKASSTTITSVANNCQKSIDEAKNSCKASIEHALQVLSQTKDGTTAQKLIQETTEEISGILQSVSSNVYGQLLEIGNRFQRRLEQVINSSDSIQPSIVAELKGIFQTTVDETDNIIIDAKQLFNPTYNPSTKLRQAVVNELGDLTAATELELNKFQSTIIDTLNRFNKGIVVAKDVQASLKKSGQLPQHWTSRDSKKTLLSCAQMTLALQFIGKMSTQSTPQVESPSTQEQQTTKSKVPSVLTQKTVDDEISLLLGEEEEAELYEDENESGSGQIFDGAKKRLRTKLVETVKNIRKATDPKTIDTCTYNALENYGVLLGDVNYKIEAKIIDFTHQFIKLYSTVLGIMGKINEGMKEKLVEIFNDQGTDATDFYYNNIRKYFAETYLTEAKMKELYTTASNSMKTVKTRKELQKQITKQLSLVTSDLVRDMDTMKSTTIYIFLEMRKGVIALQNLKNKSNVCGIRYWFNYYDGKADCAQVKKLMYIINALNINGFFEREMSKLQSSDDLSKFEAITQMIQKTLSKKTTRILTELEQKSNLREIEATRSDFLQSFNSIVTIYKLKVKNILKRVVVKFINLYEETLIIMKRKYVKEVDLLDAILDNETRNIDSEIPLFGIYLARNADISVEQDTGITLRRKFKNIREAKYTMKSSINQISEVLNSHTTEMKTEIQKVISTIVEEAKYLQQIQQDIENSKTDAINLEKLSKLEFLMQLANTLSISHGDITNDRGVDKNSSNQQLESYIDSTIERLRSEKQNAQLEIEKCTNVRQLQSQVMMVATTMKEIISDTNLEMKTHINQYTAQYNTALDAYVKLTDHETILKVLERGKEDGNIKISLSEHLKTYLQDKYSKRALETFLFSVSESENLEQNKKSIVEALNLTVKQIETDLGSIKTEAVSTIFNTFKQAIDVLETVSDSETKQRLEGKDIEKLSTLSRLLNILHDNTAIDAENSLEEVRNAITTAREHYQEEYTKSIEALSTLTKQSAIQVEIQNTVGLFESIYNTMRQVVKAKMETLSIEFYENFKLISAKTTRTETIVQEIMSGVYNNEFIKNEEYQKFLTLANSESYTSSVAVNSMYERIQRDQKISAADGQNVHILSNLNTEIDASINNIEEVVNFISQTFEEGTSIITSINEGKQLEITDVHDISVLTQGLLIYQTLLQIQNRADFASAQRIINQEYEQAMQVITNTNDVNIVEETVLRTIEKYDAVSNIIENEVTQKFMKMISDFTNKYEIIMQVVAAGGRDELLVVLQNIIEKKMSDTVSEKYLKFESYINSSSFRSTTFAKDSYQRAIQQETSSTSIENMSVEKLKIVTSKTDEYIQELDIENQFANEQFLKGARILQSIQNGNFKLTEEQIQILTECVMISQMMFRQNNLNDTRSKNDEDWEAVSIAQRSVDEEYKHTIETIKSTKEKVIVEQTISTTIYKYDDIYNNLREEMKQMFSILQIDFTTTYDTILEILQIQNVPMFNKLQKIQNKPSNISTKYTQFESYIKSEVFSSYSLIRNEFLKLKQDDKTANVNKVDYHITQLTMLTKMTSQQIDKINLVQSYVTEVLYKSTEILQSTETDMNMQLSEEQFTTLCEAFKVSKIIEAVILSEEQIEEKFLMAERSINDIYENSISEIQISKTESMQEITSINIQNYTAIYNDLRENVKEIFIHKSTFFVSTFTTVSKTVSLQNVELSSTFENIKREKTSRQLFSNEYQELVTYMTSDKFSSSSHITYMYQNQDIEEESAVTTNLKERNIKQLTAFTDEVRQSITEMNKMRQLVLKYFQENIENLRGIESSVTTKLAQEQITMLTECLSISETVTFTCVTVSSEREIIFETAETSISTEYQKTINSLKEAKQEMEMRQIMDTNIQHYEETYNTLTKDVKETLIQTSTKFSNSYEELVQHLKLTKKTSLTTTLENIQITKRLTTVIENYKKCKVYLNSESFKSNYWIQQYYDKNIKQDSNRVISKENCIKELCTITSEVNYQITQAKYTSKYIVQLFEQSTEIFKLIESETHDQTLSQEQINVLTESIIISEQVSCRFSEKNQQEEVLYTTTQKDIQNVYQNAVMTIQSSKDENAVRENFSRSAQSYSEVYNSYREEIIKDFAQTTNEFSENFEGIIKNTLKKGNGNILQTTLQDIKRSKVDIQVSEEYKKFESYIITEKFTSTNIIRKYYSKLEKQALSTTKLNEQGLNQIQSLTNEADVLITELSSAYQFVSETIQKSSNILKMIQSNSSIELTQEQIVLLTESVRIVKVLSAQCNPASLEEEKIFVLAETKIEEEWSTIVSTIRSTENVEEVQAAVTNTVKNYDKIYNQLREEVKQVFTTTTTEFTKTYETIRETTKTHENVQIAKLLENIQLKKISTNFSEEYKNFETFLSSETFTTVLLATRSYQNIVQQEMSSNSLREECIKHMESVTTDVQKYVNEMSITRKYVSQTLYQSTKILKYLEQNCNTITELTDEETKIITESILISEIISTEFDSKTAQKEEVFAAAEMSVDQQHENALHTILTATDEETIKQTMLESVQTYDTTIKSVKEEIQNAFTETTTEFTNTFNEVLNVNSSHLNEAVRAKLQDIKEHRVEVQISEEYHIFETYVTSEISSSSFSISQSYDEMQSEEESANTEMSINDRSINQLEKLTTEVNQYITQTNIVRKYVTRVFQKSIKIIKILEQGENIELTIEQTSILNESVMISEKLSSQSTTTVENVSQAATKVNEEYRNTVETLKTVTNEAEAHQAMTAVVNNYDSIYGGVCGQVQDKMRHAEENYSKKVESTLETLEERSQVRETLEKIIQGETKTLIETNQDFKTFKSYINSNTFASSESIQKLYKNLESNSEDEISNHSNVSERTLKQLTTLTEQVNKKLEDVKFVENYVSENCKKSSEILEKVSEHQKEEFTTEEIHILTITREITQTLHEQQIIETHTTSEAVDQIITQECENAVQKVQTLETEEEVKQVVDENIQSFNKKYSDLQEHTKTKLTQSSTEFEKTVNSTLKVAKSNSEIVEKIETSKQDIQNDEKMKEFKCYMENNLSSKVVEETHASFSENNEISENNKEQSIQKLKDVSKDINHKVVEMNEYEKYATENIAKGQEVLKAIQENQNLSEEQISTLAKSMEITEIINKNTKIVKEAEGEQATSAQNITKDVESQSSNNMENQKVANQETVQQDEENKIHSVTTVQKTVEEESKVAIDLIKSTDDEEKVKEIAKERIQTLDKTYHSAQQSTKTHITQTSNNFVNHLQSTVNQVENGEVRDTLNNITNNKANLDVSEEDEELKKFVSSIKSESFKSDSAMATKIEETEGTASTKEETIDKIDSVSKKMNENLQTMEETSKFISDNIQKSDHILKKVETEKEVQLTEEEIKQIARSVKITKALQESEHMRSDYSLNDNKRSLGTTDTKEEVQELKDHKVSESKQSKNIEIKNFESHQSSSTTRKTNSNSREFNAGERATMVKQENVEQSTATENKRASVQTYQSASTKHSESENTKVEEDGETSAVNEGVSEVNFTAVQNALEEENNAIIDSIKSTEDEEKVKELMKEHIQTLDSTYKNAQEDAEKKITQTSGDFVNTFQSTLSQSQNTEVRNTLNEIMNENTQYSTDNDEALQEFESHVKSEAFSSTFTATNVYQSVEKEIEDSADLKEKSILEVEAVGAKMNENLHKMEETTKFVSENLQKSSDILKKVETDKETVLNEEEVSQIARSMKITKVLYESEAMNSDTTHSTRSIDTTADNADDVVTELNTSTRTHHTETREETRQYSVQQTLTTETTDSKMADVSLTDIKNLSADDNCLSVQPQECYEDKAKVLEKMSSDKLLVKWEVTESEDKRWPSECRNLSWSNEKFADSVENRIFVDEISQVLKISRNLIENTIHMELKKLKLNRRVREDLSAITTCVANIYNILQRLSTYVFEEMERFSDALETQIKASMNSIQNKLETVSATLDDEFITVGKAFFDLQYSKSSDILDIIDEDYENEICNTTVKSKKVTKEKLEKLQSTTSTILDNIDCLVLTMLDTFVNVGSTIQLLDTSKEEMISLENMKNSQKLVREFFNDA